MKMHPSEIKNIINSMRIIVDTREQKTPQAEKRWERFGVPIVRKALSSGDYSAVVTISDVDVDFSSVVVIERKMSLDEVIGNFTRNRKRFQNEFERLKLSKTKCYLLIENANWEKVFSGNYRSAMHPNSLLASLLCYLARYNVVPIFCMPQTTSRIIPEILRREIQNYLEGECSND